MAERPGDRGGRPSELRAPPPEMPSWKKDRTPNVPRGVLNFIKYDLSIYRSEALKSSVLLSAT